MNMTGIEQAALRKNLWQLISLRGMAFYGQVATILFVYYGMNLVIQVAPMLAVTAGLIAFNIWATYRYKTGKVITEFELFAGLMIDVLALTAQLYFSDGTSNPFISLYLLPVIIGAVLLRKVYAWIIVASTLLFYGLLSLQVRVEPKDHSHHGVTGVFDLHMHGMMMAYAICACLLVFYVTRISGNLNERDRQLAALQQQSDEEAHILRMGLLSAGAAHELGTPLTTLSVILKDWRDLPLPRKKADMRADIDTMLTQVQRCKAIVSDILTASGETRGEGARALALSGFVQGMAERWRTAQSPQNFEVSIDLPDTPVVAERVIEQSVVNLLDNALEASLSHGQVTVRLKAFVSEASLIIDIDDEGAGFSDDILKRLGEPYATTKALSEKGHGRGLGLFLVMNTLRKLGGALEVKNLNPGARARLILPLSAIAVSNND